MPPQRRLAAIMFTDMVGYTSLGQRNESLALTLAEEQKTIIRQTLASHDGREVKTLGDGLLVEFSSALEAVRCALSIQTAVRESNLTSPSDRRLGIRIGVHLGDVVESADGDISGDAVNVASRVEALADEGGVCITRQVYDQVHNKLGLPTESIGSRQLKNLNTPLELFRVVMPREDTGTDPGAFSNSKRIAVLPFANMSPDPLDGYLADGMTEELITSLAGVRGLTVIARTSVMKYRATQKGVSEIARELNVGAVMEGSVRKAGERLRITVQLIDPATEGHLWAQNYDRKLDDIFAIQAEIAEKVVSELSVRLAGAEKNRLEKRPTQDPEVYMLYLKGRNYWNERSDEGLQKAVTYLEQAVRKDPGFALGYTGLADCYSVMGRNGPGEPAPNFERAKEFATKALDLDESLAEAHTALAGVLNYYSHDWDRAEAEFRRAIELKPNYSPAHQWYSHLLGAQNRLPEAEHEMAIAIQLDPLSVIMNHNMGAAYYYQGNFDKAIEWFQRANDLDPSLMLASWGSTNLIQAYVLSGRVDEAAKELQKLERLPKKVRTLELMRAYVLAGMNKPEEARVVLRKVESEYIHQQVSPYQIALVHFELDDVDEGFRWLQAAYDAHDGGVIWINSDHELKGVRGDPRFIALRKALGLPELPST